MIILHLLNAKVYHNKFFFLLIVRGSRVGIEIYLNKRMLTATETYIAFRWRSRRGKGTEIFAHLYIDISIINCIVHVDVHMYKLEVKLENARTRFSLHPPCWICYKGVKLQTTVRILVQSFISPILYLENIRKADRVCKRAAFGPYYYVVRILFRTAF